MMVVTRVEKGTTKKFLYPFLVLLLLLVGISGTAYAYSSSITVNNAEIEGVEHLVIDLRNNLPSDIVSITDSEALVFTDNHYYSETEEKNQVDAYVTTKMVATYNLKVDADADWNTIKVTSNNIATLLSKTVDTGDTLGTIFKIYVNVDAGTPTTAKELKAEGVGEATFPISKVSENQNVTIYVYLVAIDNGVPLTTLNANTVTTVRELSDVASENDHNSLYYRNLFSTSEYKFSIAVLATYIEPASP